MPSYSTMHRVQRTTSSDVCSSSSRRQCQTVRSQPDGAEAKMTLRRSQRRNDRCRTQRTPSLRSVPAERAGLPLPTRISACAKLMAAAGATAENEPAGTSQAVLSKTCTLRRAREVSAPCKMMADPRRLSTSASRALLRAFFQHPHCFASDQVCDRRRGEKWSCEGSGNLPNSLRHSIVHH
ncbi:uncharacterized protein LAESUDRAFT_441702 [Laetiporus sulphureus 93-53]|uniref:Uncharacterized protein n=1 Tax=Laetiporus sulphureus 93-53 TaxID=1314785 RepID=A0A165C2W0_9APHY|nr:uncharacterized protein LAESUDRAFT_441702 [Laetiporus sulphureus 93-53]KZT02102.1 hypothetical protein LAESUDRAFT_441702 [Laetiporus sulphureus 93-53]